MTRAEKLIDEALGLPEPPTDIYTCRPIDTKTQEHILPAALGGRLTSGDILDESTNETFGHTIDAALERALRTFRLMMGAESAHGTPPRASIVTGDDGYKYLLSSGGKVELQPSGQIEESNGTYRLQAHVANEAQLRQMLKKTAKESGHDVDELVRKAMALAGDRFVRKAMPVLNFNLSWGPEELRATVKIVCNLLAHNEPDLFRGVEFHGVRQFVLEDGEQDDWVRLVRFEMSSNLGEVDHLVRVERHDSGEVFGLVVYFGYLAFIVRLGTTKRSFPARSYRVDSLSKQQRIDDPVDYRPPLPGWGPGGDMQSYREIFLAQMNTLLPVAHDIQHRLWLNAIIEPILKRWAEEEAASGGELSEDRKHAMAGELASAVIHELEPSIAAASARRRAEAAARAGIEISATPED